MQEHDIWLLLLDFGQSNWPSHWEKFFDKIIEYYKEAFSDRVEGSIYNKDGQSSGKKNSNAIDIDSAKKKKARSTSIMKKKNFDLCWRCLKDGNLKKVQSHSASKCFTLKCKKEGNTSRSKPATTSKDSSGKENRK